ncbi:hypothetical protein FRC12_005398 [Ceratobasidium sp. 428]|nr:hypothetical protein FRC12_005398 [Ceratobasidium sp. 428]
MYQGGVPCEISSVPVLAPTLCLEFPIFLEHAGFLVRYLSLNSTWTSRDILSDHFEFCSDPSSGTLGLFVKVVGGDGGPTELAIFIDVQKILGHISKLPPQVSEVTIPWPFWGEDATRWVDLGGRPPNHPSSIHGSRFTMAYRELEPQLVVADFNPLCVRRFKNRKSHRYYQVCPEEVGNWDDFRRGIWPCLDEVLEERKMMVVNVEENTPTVMTGFSRDPIVSRLPFRLAIVGGPTFVYNEWIIDGNNLVGSKVDREARTEHLTVHRISY